MYDGCRQGGGDGDEDATMRKDGDKSHPPFVSTNFANRLYTESMSDIASRMQPG